MSDHGVIAFVIELLIDFRMEICPGSETNL